MIVNEQSPAESETQVWPVDTPKVPLLTSVYSVSVTPCSGATDAAPLRSAPTLTVITEVVLEAPGTTAPLGEFATTKNPTTSVVTQSIATAT